MARTSTWARVVLLAGWWLGLYQPADRAALAAIWRAVVRDEPGFRVLFVGVRPYTRALTRSRHSATVVTIDRDPNMRWFGARRHHVAELQDLRRLHEDPFHAAFVNGVLGYGIDTIADADRALGAIADGLRADGTLVLGINEERASTPDLACVDALARFRSVAPPPFHAARYVVPSPFEGTHAFLFFERV